MAPKRVYFRSIAEMRQNHAPPICTPPTPSICTPPTPPICMPHTPPNCMPLENVQIICRHAPYCCPQFRNISFWCEYCMSRYMFPEHYHTPPTQICRSSYPTCSSPLICTPQTTYQPCLPPTNQPPRPPPVCTRRA